MGRKRKNQGGVFELPPMTEPQARRVIDRMVAGDDVTIEVAVKEAIAILPPPPVAPAPSEPLPTAPQYVVTESAISDGGDSPLLSVLIPTLKSRGAKLGELLRALEEQKDPHAVDRIEVLLLENDGGIIGDLRNRLLDAAKGEYCVFIDDDDRIALNYLPQIMNALQGRQDCVCFNVGRFVNGRQVGLAKHSLAYKTFSDIQNGGWTSFERTPNHLNVIRTSISRQIRFVPIDQGEDRDFAERLKSSGLLKSQAYVDDVLYDYMKVIA